MALQRPHSAVEIDLSRLPPVVLASASPRRRKLLCELGLRFEIVPPDIDERVASEWGPEQAAERLATAKAEIVADRFPCRLIIAADTVVAKGDEILGKPESPGAAVRILRTLSGSRHRVITGVCMVCRAQRWQQTASETTWVEMRPMSEREIHDYVASGEAMGKAGAYAIQETADRYVTNVEGSFTNVVGLPVELVQRMLREFLDAQNRGPRDGRDFTRSRGTAR